MASAHALPPARAGMLECQGGHNVGFVVGSVASLDCVFRGGGRPEAYVATVRRFGLDLGITEQTQMTWAVNAPSSRFGHGELAGTYGGVGANASVGVGGGGNFLVGGPRMPTRCSRSACRARPDSTSRPASPGSSWSRSGTAGAARALAPLAVAHAAHDADDPLICLASR